MLSTKMRALIEENTLGLVATVTPDGRPAVSPKATTVVVDERRLAFSNLRSPNTVRNIRANPAVELNFIDVFRRQACRVAGTARYVERGDPRFDELMPLFSAWSDLVERMQGCERGVLACGPLATAWLHHRAQYSEIDALVSALKGGAA